MIQSSCPASPEQVAGMHYDRVEYRDIPGCPGYRAGSDGSIWSCLKQSGNRWQGNIRMVESDRWKRLKPDVRPKDGRKRYTLRSESGKYVRRYGSYFVLLAFTGDRSSEDLQACHFDGDCTNDAPSNLRWDTCSANQKDKHRHGTMRQGEKVHTAKLSAGDVIEIRKLLDAGWQMAELAKRYGVTIQNIYHIKHRKSWKHA
jgi:hypothetical protein